MAQPLQRRRHQISAKLPRLAALAGKGRGHHNSTNHPRRSPWLKPTRNSDSALVFNPTGFEGFPEHGISTAPILLAIRTLAAASLTLVISYAFIIELANVE